MFFDVFNTICSFQNYIKIILANKLNVNIIIYLDNILIYIDKADYIDSVW